jgi:hypothetical protein
MQEKKETYSLIRKFRPDNKNAAQFLIGRHCGISAIGANPLDLAYF